MKNRQRDIYISVVLSAIIMVIGIYLGSNIFNRTQIDFTEESIYSLSKGTKDLVKKINTPIMIELYYSKTAAAKGTEGIRAFNNYFEYVRDLLKEYADISKNVITLRVIDPRPDTPDEENAMRAGLKRFPLTETEKYFFGLVVRSDNGSEKVIEFFDPNKQATLEYDLTKTIYSVTDPVKKSVGILSSIKVMAPKMSPYIMQMMRMQGKNPGQSWAIIQVMKEFYRVKEIKSNVSEIVGVDILVIIHPKGFSNKLLFAIDQFVLKGGKVLLLVDQHALVAQQKNQMGMPPQNTESSNLKILMDKWGVELVDSSFVGDKNLAGQGRLSQFSAPSKLLPLVRCDRRCVTGLKDTVTSSLNNLVFLYPGYVKKIGDDPAIKISPIVQTTKEGNYYQAQIFEMNNPNGLMSKFREGKESIPLAYKIVGKFKTAFPNGIEFEEESSSAKNEKKDTLSKKIKRKLTGIKESKKESAIIVFSDVDFIHDQFSFKRNLFGLSYANDNPKLFLNSLDHLSGSTELMAIRSKGKFNRSFDVIDAIEEEASKNTASKVKEINMQIRQFQRELAQIGKQGGNIALIQNKGMKKQKELQKKISVLKGELREVKRSGREKIESIGKILQYFNTLFMPVVLLVAGLIFGYIRHSKKAHGYQK